MTTSLVTGGAGFIGSNLAIELVKKGHHVRVVDNFLTGKKENLSPILRDIHLFEGSITDKDLMQKACKGVDVVFHEAALPSVPRSVQDPLTTNDINVIGTLNTLIAARDQKVRKVVFASSSSVYGDAPSARKSEKLQPSPMSPYAATKLMGELYCRQFSELYGLDTVSLRYFNVFGPGQDRHSQYAAVIPKFIHAMLRKQRPVVYGDGTQSRDFTFVQNVVEANLLASKLKRGSGTVFNIACGRAVTLNQLIQTINTLLGTHIQPLLEAPRQGDIHHSQADITLAKEYLGFAPLISFEDGLKKTIEWVSGKKVLS